MVTQLLDPSFISDAPLAEEAAADEPIIIGGKTLTLDEVIRVARYGAKVHLTDDEDILQRVAASCDYIAAAVKAGKPIYGVTSGFGGMAHVVISPEEASELQNNAIWFMKTGAGKRLPVADVRAAMLLRANSHLHGASGLRLEIIRRIEIFLNAHVTPHVCEFGSIGASGDLAP
ncbi:MAG TPA: aromatic amino acid lyase, partial [Anaerolineae bacterium]|nr:aromatic amino acid lyase [Anaerolineae bacterium]